MNACFFKQLPGNGLPTGFTGFGGTTGIFPGSGEGLFSGSPGKQQFSVPVIDPDTGNESEFTLFPGCSPEMDPAGPLPILIVYII